MIYMIIAGYFEDDDSDELTNDPVFKAVLNKDALASQPTVSRFFNRMDEDTLNQFLTIGRILRITYLIGLDDWRYQQICESNVLIPSV